MGKKKSEKLGHDGHQHYLNSQYPSSGVATTFYYGCIHRKLCSGKMSLKDDNLTVKDYHTCVRKTKCRFGFYSTYVWPSPNYRCGWTKKPAVQIANEVMERPLRNMKVCLNALFGHFEWKNILYTKNNINLKFYFEMNIVIL